MDVALFYLKTLFIVRYRQMIQQDMALPYIYVISFFIIHAIAWENEEYNYILFLLVAEQIKYHLTRRDLSFLENKVTSVYFLLFLEYLLIALIPIAVLLLMQAYLFTAVYVVLIAILPLLPQLSSNYWIKYPFANSFPEWKIYFRKKNLLVVAVIPYVLLVPAIMYDNINISWFGFIVISVVVSLIYFEREPIFFLKKVAFSSKEYLRLQIREAMMNSTILILPYSIIIGLFYPQEWQLIIGISIGALLPVVLALILKYAYYDSQLIQQFGFGVVLATVFQPVMIVLVILFLVVSYKKCLLFLKNIIDG